MPEPTIQVLASRKLLQEVCGLLMPFLDDAVLIGGWVPEIRYPHAFPSHVGSIDVDFAMRASKARHAEVVALLVRSGFRPGKEPYQFFKNIDVDGKSVPVRLDLLTSPKHHAATFAGTTAALFSAAGSDLAFQDNTVEAIGSATVRVAGIVALIVMKAYAMQDRTKAKDAYDLNFCLENFPGGISALAEEFTAVITDPSVRDILTKLGHEFRDEEARGSRDVVEIEGQMGEARAIRKFAVFTNLDDFLKALGIR
jgi:hypothetical protein